MNLFNMFGKANKSERTSFTERLRGLGYDADTQTNVVLALLVGSTVELSQGTHTNFDFECTVANETCSYGERHQLLP